MTLYLHLNCAKVAKSGFARTDLGSVVIRGGTTTGSEETHYDHGSSSPSCWSSALHGDPFGAESVTSSSAFLRTHLTDRPRGQQPRLPDSLCGCWGCAML